MSSSGSPDDVDHLLAPKGPIARAFSDGGGEFEERPQQLQMARAVQAALSSGRHALIEGGTGVGKSFAYLVPALSWAARTGGKVAVATSTIALQEQLVQKDLPRLAASLPFDVSFALVKGRGNYLCTRRLHRALAETGSLFDGDEAREQLASILRWSAVTKEGARQDLPFRPLPSVWESVRAEQGNCLGRACAFYAGCHYQRSRRRAHTVNLLVLNHHVLLADLALRRSGASFLPDIDVVVVDEAHDFEDTAAEHLGLRVSSLGMLHQLGRLWNPTRRTGLLHGDAGERLRAAVTRTRKAARAYFADAAAQLPEERSRGTVELPADFTLPASFAVQLNELAGAVAEWSRGVNDMEQSMELGARARGLGEAAGALETVVQASEEGFVRWAEVRPGARGTQAMTLVRSPIDVGPALDEVLWSKHASVILTSATLTTGKPASFDFMRRRLGLDAPEMLSVGSPFEYRRQARLVLRTDLPDPGANARGYEDALCDAVFDAVRRTDGGAFVLFTAYGAMRRTVEALRDRLEAADLTVLVQGEDLERSALLDRFREGGCVLFGVSSFWQGVDVPGDALRHVVIARLPFEVPTHPLQRARSDHVSSAGGDPFRDLAVPQAALRLKQGFGRLIRRSDDSGVVTILDPRIVRKSYGRVLLDSLPECPVELVPDEGQSI